MVLRTLRGGESGAPLIVWLER